eukprot:8966525-Alexandrium_andersonii.AAC.1
MAVGALPRRAAVCGGSAGADRIARVSGRPGLLVGRGGHQRKQRRGCGAQGVHSQVRCRRSREGH